MSIIDWTALARVCGMLPGSVLSRECLFKQVASRSYLLRPITPKLPSAHLKLSKTPARLRAAILDNPGNKEAEVDEGRRSSSMTSSLLLWNGSVMLRRCFSARERSRNAKEES